jgi:hypothetical protein
MRNEAISRTRTTRLRHRFLLTVIGAPCSMPYLSNLTNHLLESLQSIHLPYLTLSDYRDDDGGDAEHI